MNKTINFLKENKYLHYILILIIGIILGIFILNIQIVETHDGTFHLLRLLGTWDALSIGEFPPMVIPDFCRGTGYAMNLFYPPIVTYLPLLVKLITPTYAMTLKIFGIISIVLSGFTMYHFTYEITKKRQIALFSAFLYIIAPYKLGNVYRRYAIGEFVALIFLPILFQGMFSLFKGDGKKHYYIAIGASLLMLTHTLTTFYAAIFCVIFIVFYLPKLKEKEILKKIGINAIFIILISMLFWGPMLEAKTITNYTLFNDELMRTTSDYAAYNTIELSQFFVDKNIDMAGDKEPTTYIIGIPILILSIATIFTIRKVDTKYKDIYIIFTLFSFISLYLTTKYFPWRIMPNIICKLQYPWRMIGFFNFFSSLICAINLYIIVDKISKNDLIKIIVTFILITISITYTVCVIRKFEAQDKTKDEKYENRILENTKINHMRINRDYIPLKAIYLQDTYMQTRQDRTYVLDGEAQIISEEKNNLSMDIYIKNIKESTILEFPYLYYPGYVITLETNENKIKLIDSESNNGYLAIKIKDNIEEAKIQIRYKATNITKFSYIISFISIIVLIVYIIIENKNYKKELK